MKQTTAIDMNLLDRAIVEALDVLKKDRDRLVVAKRHGVAGEDITTLEGIGRELGITRERVRQIEKAALGRIADSPSASSELSPHFGGVVGRFGGIVAFDELLRRLNLRRPQAAATAFLIKLDPEIDLLPENDDHTAVVIDNQRYQPKDIARLHSQLIAAAKKVGRPAKFSSLIKQVDGVHAPESLAQLGRVSKMLVEFEALWGLQSWPEVNPKSIRDKAYLVLKRTGRPMHFSDIAKQVRTLKPNTKKVTTQAVHNELIKDKRFVLIGRGIYALAQWGYAPGTVSDIIEQVLREESPLPKDEIIRRVLARRMVKPTTIVLNLQEKPQFERTGKATYKLKAPQEDK